MCEVEMPILKDIACVAYVFWPKDAVFACSSDQLTSRLLSLPNQILRRDARAGNPRKSAKRVCGRSDVAHDHPEQRRSGEV